MLRGSRAKAASLNRVKLGSLAITARRHSPLSAGYLESASNPPTTPNEVSPLLKGMTQTQAPLATLAIQMRFSSGPGFRLSPLKCAKTAFRC